MTEIDDIAIKGLVRRLIRQFGGEDITPGSMPPNRMISGSEGEVLSTLEGRAQWALLLASQIFADDSTHTYLTGDDVQEQLDAAEAAIALLMSAGPAGTQVYVQQDEPTPTGAALWVETDTLDRPIGFWCST